MSREGGHSSPFPPLITVINGPPARPPHARARPSGIDLLDSPCQRPPGGEAGRRWSPAVVTAVKREARFVGRVWASQMACAVTTTPARPPFSRSSRRRPGPRKDEVEGGAFARDDGMRRGRL